MTKGRIFDISRGCVDDGPGLRTVVFLKGCSLTCPWCHNPEGRSPKPLIGFDAARCIACGECHEVCERGWTPGSGEWRDGCLVCGACARACPTGARRLVGRDVDRDFFTGTGGGVTFSGGEPLLQAEFLFACAAALRGEGIHVAVETAAMWSASLRARLCAAADLLLVDIKHVDTARLAATMGFDCAPMLANLAALVDDEEVAVELRLTLGPGFNADDEDLEAIANWLAARRRRLPVTLQRFHRMAAGKIAMY